MVGTDEFQAIIAIATVAAVIVALFGDRIRASMFKPKLKLELKEPLGSKTETTLGENKSAPSRYYHLSVTNKIRWPKAHNVQVFLSLIETPGPDGEFRTAWVGDVPMRWQFQEFNPLKETIGSTKFCDLCEVTKGKWLQILPVFVPNALRHRFRIHDEPAKPRMRLTLQARSDESDSEPILVEIAWDKEWYDGDREMADHFIVKEIQPKPS